MWNESSESCNGKNTELEIDKLENKMKGEV